MLLTAAGYALQPDFATDPAISPDGEQVCFAYEGDLWLVPFTGGEAQRITATEASEWAPFWSPDGDWIAFNSDREGRTYPYVIPSGGGAARLVTAESYSVSDWFSDGENLLVTRYSQEFGNSFYKLPLNGKRPILLAEIGDRYASLSPDNKSIVFNRRGDPHREAYQGSLAGELWELDIATKNYTKLTDTDFTERYPRFSHVDNSLYFCASDGERFQICRVDDRDFSQPIQLTGFRQWSARDISIARENDRIVFEHFNEIWKYDPTVITGDRTTKLQIHIRQDLWEQDQREMQLKDDIDSFAVSGDELLVGFQAKYDVFFVPRKGGEVKRVTTSQAGMGDLEFMDDNRTLVMKMLKQGRNKIHTVTCDSTMAIKPLDWYGSEDLDVESISRDPGGRWVIYYGDNRVSSRIAIGDKDLQNIRDLGTDRPVVTNLAISNSGDHAVYATTREDFWIRELWLYDFENDEHRKLFNDDAWIHSLAWTRDDRSILMSRGGDIYRLDLVPRDELEFEDDHWQEIYSPEPAEDDSTQVPESERGAETEEEPAEEQPPQELNIVWEGIEKRLFPVITEPQFSLFVQRVIDDSTFYYIARDREAKEPTTLKKANLYGKNVTQEHELGQDVGYYKWAGDTLYYLRGNSIHYYNPQNKSKGDVETEFDYTYSTKLLNTLVFEQVWGVFGLNFYDPNMHGKDWQGLYDLYHPYAEEARSIEDIRFIVEEMIGDVNASHTGFYPRREEASRAKQLAYLGVEFDQTDILEEGVGVSLAYPTSKLASYYGVKAGDIITHIDEVKITAQTPLDSLLTGKVGEQIDLRYISDGSTRNATVTGLSYYENRQLYYQYDVSRKKQTVEELTEGRIGYVHIPGMGNTDYENFRSEVFRENADKEALIIDVRGNHGGHVHDQIISMINREPYAWSTSRRYSGERQLEPRRAWMRPTIVLVDEGSFSDGEIFPTVYQELKLGKVVGQPSSGSVIGTWQYELLDGSSMRMPGSGWYRLDGTNMEGNGVTPDIVVEITPEDKIAGRDTQLMRAIEEILREI
ncbi:MAG: S41 family peptidase [Candidatus Syntrophosphaera sp.]